MVGTICMLTTGRMAYDTCGTIMAAGAAGAVNAAGAGRNTTSGFGTTTVTFGAGAHTLCGAHTFSWWPCLEWNRLLRWPPSDFTLSHRPHDLCPHSESAGTTATSAGATAAGVGAMSVVGGRVGTGGAVCARTPEAATARVRHDRRADDRRMGHPSVGSPRDSPCSID